MQHGGTLGKVNPAAGYAREMTGRRGQSLLYATFDNTRAYARSLPRGQEEREREERKKRRFHLRKRKK